VNPLSNSERCGALTSKELLEVLDKLFPDRCPLPTDTDREIWMKVGQRQVVDRMRAWYDSVEASSYQALDPR